MMIHTCFDYYPSSSSWSNTSATQASSKEPVIKSKAGGLPVSRVEFTTGQWTKLTNRSNKMVVRANNGFLWDTNKYSSKHINKLNSRATRTGPRNTSV